MYYLVVQNSQIIAAGECPVSNEDMLNIEVDKNIFEDYIADPLKYVYKDNKIVENPDYDLLKNKEQIQKQIEDIVEKLAILDNKRIRAVCEDEIRDERTGETWLDFYNSQIYDLRIELKSLEAQLL